jgi:VanZ family protein
VAKTAGTAEAMGGHSRSLRAFDILALLLLVPLLVGNRWHYAPRSFYAGWDLGHILAFALWTALLLRHISSTPASIAQRRIRVQLGVIFGFALLFGGLAEGLQTLMGNRLPSLLDMSRNLLGALCGWTFFSPGLKVCKTGCRWCIRLVEIALLLVSLLPLGRALVDEHQARRAFPVLASFNQPFELDRWSHSARCQIADPPFDPGNSMLEIDFLTDKYSWISLNQFPRDWRGFKYFTFSAYNPEPTALEVVCRINDKRHNREGYRYRDRFNRRLNLPPGWSHIRLSMEEITTAPEDRRMDLDDILQVGFFTISLPTPRTLYLDDVRLLP